MWKDGRQLDGAINFADPGIKIMTYKSAKGLEFDTVFLPELQKYKVGDGGVNIMKELYVLASRAKKQLFLFFSGEGNPPVLNVLRDCGAMEFLRDERDDEHR
jgi:superfamily I DNA/RNA helicase